MKTIIVIIFTFSLYTICKAQQLDRISISSGGASSNEVNYVIGETFNFTMAEGDVIVETGSLGSNDNTGGDNNYTQVQEISMTSPMKCFPNPVKDILTLFTGIKTGENINLLVYNALGQIVYRKALVNQDELHIDLQNLKQGIYHLAIIEISTKKISAVKIIKQ